MIVIEELQAGVLHRLAHGVEVGDRLARVGLLELALVRIPRRADVAHAERLRVGDHLLRVLLEVVHADVHRRGADARVAEQLGRLLGGAVEPRRLDVGDPLRARELEHRLGIGARHGAQAPELQPDRRADGADRADGGLRRAGRRGRGGRRRRADLHRRRAGDHWSERRDGGERTKDLHQ